MNRVVNLWSLHITYKFLDLIHVGLQDWNSKSSLSAGLSTIVTLKLECLLIPCDCDVCLPNLKSFQLQLCTSSIDLLPLNCFNWTRYGVSVSWRFCVTLHLYPSLPTRMALQPCYTELYPRLHFESQGLYDSV